MFMVPIVNVDMIAVIVAAIAAFIVGMIWYSPMLFGKKWMKIMGVTEKDMGKNKDKMMGIMLSSLVVSGVTAYVFAHILAFSQASTITDAVQGSVWVWLGFVATTLYMGVLYEKKSMDWYILSAGHYLFAIIAMGIVLVSL